MKPIACAALLLSTALTLPGEVISYDKCRDRLPDTLNVGVPRIATLTREDSQELREHIRSAFSLMARRLEEDCRQPRPIQINVATGSDYQVLDWMSQGAIDAAIVPDLSLSLLSRDGMALYEVTAIGSENAAVLLPESRPQPEARPLKALFAKSTLDPLKELDAFLDEVWAGALSSKPTPPGRQLVLASHLSSTGFAWPIARALNNFNERLGKAGRENDSELIENMWSRFFASTRFTIDCTDVQQCLETAFGAHLDARGQPKLPDDTVVILFPGEEVVGEEENGVALPAARPHLILTAGAAKRMFDTGDRHLSSPSPKTPEVLAGMIQGASADYVPSALRAVFVPEPVFGVRTYGFTIDEAVRLFRQQQRTTADSNLALVLPGGGVKAAYQTRIIDELYKGNYLRNEAAGASEQNVDALAVRTVIGTSGGALLGYFVSQLGAKPLELYKVLWEKDGATLTSTQIFGWTDLLRWISIVASLAIFCVLLFVFLFFTSAPADSRPGKHAYRWRLTLALLPLFFVAPVVLRIVSPSDIEHIPEIEGFVYAVMAVVVMLADQALIYDPARAQPESERLRRRDLVLIVLGLALLSVPVFGSRLSDQLPFGVAFISLVILIVGGAIATIKVLRGRIDHPMWRAAEIAVSVAGVLLLCSRGWILPEMQIFAFLALIVIGFGQFAYVRWMKPVRGYQLILTFLAILMIAELCWPRQVVKGDWQALLSAPSLQISTAAFFMSLGFILLLIGFGIRTSRASAYQLDSEREGLGMAMLVLALYLLVAFLTIFLLTKFAPGFVTPLELTGRFWLTLIVVSLVIGAAVIAVLQMERVRQSRWGKAIPYLVGQHPNGTIVQRRYVRLLVVAVFAVTWWNVVQAPALYGNRHALEYHAGAIEQFNAKRCPPRSNCGAFEPTARFVAPANLLQQDGTRYFMFLPRTERDCPAIPNRPASGAQWLVFRGDGRTGEGCRPKPSEHDIREVTFASGSPFPIFPAHKLAFVTQSAGGEENAFVDGGYSNNVPVDAARTLGARQVLIIQSSCPLRPDGRRLTPFQRAKRRVFGKLVRNSPRVLDYLFERSQQVDRLSARDMFVVSLSPSRNEVNWPPLFDFRTSVVERMRDTASADLGKRIGLVESWGQPSFALHSELIRSAPSARQ